MYHYYSITLLSCTSSIIPHSYIEFSHRSRSTGIILIQHPALSLYNITFLKDPSRRFLTLLLRITSILYFYCYLCYRISLRCTNTTC
ncbi:hypothetical protein SCHPADRAFT_542131 [Schizopora paradoxa]|uniref:Uncharacterized protein n=1 Tax=Schizopora paradoxa TaxID=27342 RepID=A0A0H2RKK2_9AGAM|nr:hypothetical protein SCHPADRAFT_542131 [Schizopora paradoxa]